MEDWSPNAFQNALILRSTRKSGDTSLHDAVIDSQFYVPKEQSEVLEDLQNQRLYGERAALYLMDGNEVVRRFDIIDTETNNRGLGTISLDRVGPRNAYRWGHDQLAELFGSDPLKPVVVVRLIIALSPSHSVMRTAQAMDSNFSGNFNIDIGGTHTVGVGDSLTLNIDNSERGLALITGI